MANTKISALTADAAVADTDTTVVYDGVSATKKITVSTIRDFLGRVIIKALGADATSSGAAATSLKNASNIAQALTAGTWMFEYRVIYQSSNATNGMKFTVSLSDDTLTMPNFIVAEGTQFESNTATITGAASQNVTTYTMRSGGALRTTSDFPAAIVTSTSVDATDSNMLVVITGTLKVDYDSTIQLFYASEVNSTGTQTLKAQTCLYAIKIA